MDPRWEIVAWDIVEGVHDGREYEIARPVYAWEYENTLPQPPYSRREFQPPINVTKCHWSDLEQARPHSLELAAELMLEIGVGVAELIGLFFYGHPPIIWIPQPGGFFSPRDAEASCTVDKAKKSFLDSQEFAGQLTRRDPLILDLDGQGIKTINVQAGVHFDHNGDGFAELTGWVDAPDGLLVMDRNGDGVINDGRELFGDQTILKNGARAANGFQALAELDTNKDGKIDANDPEFSRLKVWTDGDADGQSSQAELHSLDDVGIKSFGLDSTIANTPDPQGNIQNRVGSFERTDGTIGHMADCGLLQDTTYTIPRDLLVVGDDIAALPDLEGFGNVYGFHQAMSRDTTGQLKSLVEQFINASDPNSRSALVEQILFKWTGTENIDSGSRGNSIDARRLVTLEKIFGQSFVGASGPNPTNAGAVLLNESFREIFEMTYAQLMAQTHLKDLYDKLTYFWDDERLELKTSFSRVIPELLSRLNDNSEQGKQLIGEFARTLRGNSLCPEGCYLIFRETMLEIDASLGWVIDTGGLPVRYVSASEHHWHGTDNAEAIRANGSEEGDSYLKGVKSALDSCFSLVICFGHVTAFTH